MNADVLKVEAESETCCVCGVAGEELSSPEEHDAVAPPAQPPLRAVLLHLNNTKMVPSGRLCASCIHRALEAYNFSTMLAAKGPPPLSEKIRALRKRLHELTQKIDVFIVVGGGATGAGAYSEEDIIAVDRGALEAAQRADAAAPARTRTLRGDHGYQCTVCPLTFQRAGEYRGHAARHPAEARHSCWTCGAQFPRADAAAAHARAHAPPDPLACRRCDAAFPSADERRRHEGACAAPRALRLPDRFLCGYDACILRFHTRGALLAHVRKCHAAEPPEPPGAGAALACQHCARLFASGAALKRHARVHRAPAPAPGPGPAPASEGAEWGGEELEEKEEYLEMETLEESDEQ